MKPETSLITSDTTRFVWSNIYGMFERGGLSRTVDETEHVGPEPR